MADTCFEFNLDQLAEVGCHVTIEEDGPWTIAYISLPDGSAIRSPTEDGKVILYSWYGPSQDAINRLVAIGAEPAEIEDIPF